MTSRGSLCVVLLWIVIASVLPEWSVKPDSFLIVGTKMEHC